MNEPVEETKPEELLAEMSPEPRLPEPTETPESPATDIPAWTGPSWLRLAYAFEFLFALIAIFTLWSQVGGQGHLDLLPWYIKLGCSLSLAWCCVRFTAGIVEHPKAWNQNTLLWFLGMIIVAILMGGITYYYHLHEVPEEPDNEDATSTALHLPELPAPLEGAANRR